MNFPALFAELQLVYPRLLMGVGTTLLVSGLAILFGSLLGFLLGLANHFGGTVMRVLTWVYLDVVRGTPVLVLILATYYVLPITGLALSARDAGLVALTIFCSAQVAEVIRGGLMSVAPGQDEAAKSIGLNWPKRLTYVILPQAIRQALPAWINAAVEIVKASTLLSVIGATELMLTIQQTIARNYMNAEFYLVAALIYLAINLGISAIGKRVEKAMAF